RRALAARASAVSLATSAKGRLIVLRPLLSPGAGDSGRPGRARSIALQRGRARARATLAKAPALPQAGADRGTRSRSGDEGDGKCGRWFFWQRWPSGAWQRRRPRRSRTTV